MPHKDVVYWWSGGRSEGRWCQADSGSDAASATIAYLNRMGYVAVRGSSAIGPPEGPPDSARFEALGL